MAKPPPPPPRRRSKTTEKLRRMAARERPFEPSEAPERYAKPHHFAINPYQVTDEELRLIVGDRIDFSKPAGEVFTEEQQWNSWSTGKADSDWFRPDRLSGSDYSGGFVYRANFLAFREEWEDENAQTPFFVELYGGHGTYGIALYIPNTPREVWEALLELEQYASLDDDRVGALEMEAADEAWESWAKDEYKKLWAASDLGSDGDPDYAEGWVDEISDGDWYEHFNECMQTANVYWEPQGDTREVFVDVGRVFEECDEPPERGGTPSAGPSSAPDAPPLPESEPPPRGRWTDAQVRAFRARGLRQGYDFNPPRRVNEFFASDPYRGIVIHQLQNDYYSPLYEPGTILQNVTHDEDPHERAILLMRTREGEDYIVAWWKRTTRPMPGYVLTFFNPKALPLEVSRIGTVASVEELIVDTSGPNRLTTQNDWDIVIRSMVKDRGGDAAAVYLRWYDDSGETPALRNLGSPHHPNVSIENLKVPYKEVFETYERRQASVDELMGLLGVGRGHRQAEPEPEPEPMPERPSRFKWTDAQVRAFKGRGLRQGYDFNPAEEDPPFLSFLANDPYQGLQIGGGVTSWLIGGTVVHNAAWDNSRYDRAMLLIRDADEYYFLVCWWKTGAEYTVTTFDLSDVLKNTYDSSSLDSRIPKELPSLSQAEWDYLGAALASDPPPPALLALYYRLWDDAEVTPRLWELATLSAAVGTWAVEADDLEFQYSEVFKMEEAPIEMAQRWRRAREGGFMQAGTSREARPAPAPSAPQPFWLEGPEERPPRFPYSERQVEAFRARGLRQGYDFNPGQGRTPDTLSQNFAGGLAEGMGSEQFDPEQLAVGTRTEMEHTDDVELARTIAMDHLVEDPYYYQRLHAAGL